MDLLFNIESPCNHEVFYDGICVKGWAFSTNDDTPQIYILMGKKKYVPQQQLEREDVYNEHPSAGEKALYSGFQYEFHINDFEKNKDILIRIYSQVGNKEYHLGTIMFEARRNKESEVKRRIRFIKELFDESGVRSNTLENVELGQKVSCISNLLLYGSEDKVKRNKDNGRIEIVYNIECPKNHDFAKFGCIKMEGWALTEEDEDLSIYIMMGGKKIIPNQKLERKDVFEAYSALGDKALYCGFSCLIVLEKKDLNRDSILRVYAKCAEQETCLGSFMIETPDNQEREILRHLRLFGMTLQESACRRRLPKGYNLKYAVGLGKNLLLYGDELKSYGKQRKSSNKYSSSVSKDPYDVWVKKHTYDERRMLLDKKDIEKMSELPFISVIMPAYNSDEKFLKEAIESVRQQVYSKWQLVIVDDCSKDDTVQKCVSCYKDIDSRVVYCRTEKNLHISGATNYGVEHSEGEYLLFMDHDDLLEKNALYEVAKAINQNNLIDIIYSDDDKIDVYGNRYDPQFKPDYSEELLLSYMYFSHLLVIRKELFSRLEGFRLGYEGSQDYDLVLRATELTNQIIHLPQILYHWRATENSTAFNTDTKPYSLVAGMKAVEDAVARRGISATVTQPEFAEKNKLGIFSLKYKEQCDEDILVSIVIPSKNHKDLLERCISSIEEKTTYKNYEVLVVDNGSDDKETLDYLANLPHRVLSVPNKNGKFNFSMLVNAGVREAHGKYVILLNNDTEVIEPKWIENMLVYCMMDDIGIVGAKLLYSDYTVQHAGVVIKMENDIAGHANKLISNQDGGYLSYAKVARNYSAVTAACFMVSRNLYLDIGGFDEENFAVSYNDVDFCMRVQQRGLRIVYNPEVLLFHHEGKSRGVQQTGHYSDAGEEYNFYSKYVKRRDYQDPFFNPHLSYKYPDFRIACENVWPREKRNLNVLLISHNLNYEGATLVQFLVAKNLLSEGYSFTVIASQDGLLKDDYESIGVEVIVEDIITQRNTIEYSEFLEYLKNISKKYQLSDYDLIYTNTVENYWGVTLGDILDIPTVFGIHESVNYRSYFSVLSDEYQKEFAECIRKATKVLFVAEATALLFSELSTYNTTVIRNGIELGQIIAYKGENSKEDVRRRLELKKSDIVITVVGTVCERKGQIYLLKAAKILKENNPERSFVFQIVGAKPSSYLDYMLEYIKENGLESIVRILPYSSNQDMYQYYRASDIFTCCSLEESSPLVILEAMAFEIPIVSTNVFGIPELVRDKQDAILVNARNEDELASGIQMLLDENGLGTRITKNAWFRLKTFFTLNQMVEQYDYLFQSVYEEGKNYIYEKETNMLSSN